MRALRGAWTALALCACRAAGPDYVPPRRALPAEHAPQVELASAEVDLAHWWRALEVPLLDELVERALAQHPDVAAADARVAAARAALEATARQDLPALELSAALSRRRQSAEAFGGGAFTAERESELHDLGFDARWELDLFGRNRRAEEAALAGLEAESELARAARVRLAGEVARTWLEHAGVEERAGLARAELAELEQLEQLEERRVDAGLGPEIDRAQVRARAALLASTLPAFAERAEALRHALATLAGDPPAAWNARLAAPGAAGSPPGLPGLPALGVPADLLRTRPDVRAAERALAAAVARVGVAAAELYPRLALAGSFGWLGTGAGQLGDSSANAWSFGPQLSLPLFDRQRLHALVRVEEARAEEAFALWEGSVMAAQREVADALSACVRRHEREAALADAVAQNELLVELARSRHEGGWSDARELIEARAALQAARSELSAAREAGAIAWVSLCKALGGGWDGGSDGGWDGLGRPESVSTSALAESGGLGQPGAETPDAAASRAR